MYRIVSGGKWTLDGRWVVTDGRVIVFDPDYDLREPNTLLALMNLYDCREWISENA